MKKAQLLLFMLFSLSGIAQTTIITGVVSDEQNLPLPGVSITVKKTNNGTQYTQYGHPIRQ